MDCRRRGEDRGPKKKCKQETGEVFARRRRQQGGGADCLKAGSREAKKTQAASPTGAWAPPREKDEQRTISVALEASVSEICPEREIVGELAPSGGPFSTSPTLATVVCRRNASTKLSAARTQILTVRTTIIINLP